MEKNFSVILSELRKERGLSQKEAAAKLGISQALLSHYEKGIRECGHSFLLRVADFYGVTCDYLLGRTTERNDFQTVASKILMVNDDYLPTSKTCIKAAMILREAMNDSEKLAGLRFDMVLAMGVYKLLLIQAHAGNLPKNWAGRAYADGEVICTPTYLNIIDTVSYNAYKVSSAKTPVPDEPVPEAVETLVKMSEDFIFNSVTSEMPPIPIEFIK